MCSALLAGLFLAAIACSGMAYFIVRTFINPHSPHEKTAATSSPSSSTSSSLAAPSPSSSSSSSPSSSPGPNLTYQSSANCSRTRVGSREERTRYNLTSRDFRCFMLLACGAACASGTTAMPTHSNITSILNELLRGYDSRLRPGYGGTATIVKADMNIRSMGPISEVDMSYSMDAYFRQTWSDKRLQFQGPIEEMAVHIKMLDLIWKPDTYFYNGRGSYLHTTTTPNKLLRIRQDGTVLYSMRLTIKASCPMYLHYFPVDEQLCPLQFGSYAYTLEELKYVWKHGNDLSIKISKDMRMSQFDLTGHPTGNNMTVRNRSGEFSTLQVSFRLQRHMGYFLIQVYVPCTLIVILSWVSFWINREATADRVGLGITTVLTLTTVSLDSRDDLPKVSYATALDWFILMCYGFVIASLLEFAGVHYFTKIGSGEMRHSSDTEEDSLDVDDDVIYNQVQHTVNDKFYMNNYNHISADTCLVNSRSGRPPPPERRVSSTPAPPASESCFKKFIQCVQGNASYRKMMMKRSQLSGVNSVSMIDKVSRVLFPLAFTGLNVMYWIAYTR